MKPLDMPDILIDVVEWQTASEILLFDSTAHKIYLVNEVLFSVYSWCVSKIPHSSAIAKLESQGLSRLEAGSALFWALNRLSCMGFIDEDYQRRIPDRLVGLAPNWYPQFRCRDLTSGPI